MLYMSLAVCLLMVGASLCAPHEQTNEQHVAPISKRSPPIDGLSGQVGRYAPWYQSRLEKSPIDKVNEPNDVYEKRCPNNFPWPPFPIGDNDKRILYHPGEFLGKRYSPNQESYNPPPIYGGDMRNSRPLYPIGNDDESILYNTGEFLGKRYSANQESYNPPPIYGGDMRNSRSGDSGNIRLCTNDKNYYDNNINSYWESSRSSPPYGFGLGKRSADYYGQRGDVNNDINQQVLADLIEQYDDTPDYEKRARPYSFGLGKRFSEDDANEEKRARMYDFGLGKRVPLYNFGLGKRARTYSFGLGKRLSKYNFGLGKRERDMNRFSFGLGKRSTDDIDDSDTEA